MPYVNPNKAGLFEGSFFWESIWALSYKFFAKFSLKLIPPTMVGGFLSITGKFICQSRVY